MRPCLDGVWLRLFVAVDTSSLLLLRRLGVAAAVFLLLDTVLTRAGATPLLLDGRACNT